MRYCVAYVSYFDNELKQTLVEADSPVAAIVIGVGQIDPNLKEWLATMPSDLEEIEETFFNQDAAVSVIPVE